jgi:hypothetical protein
LMVAADVQSATVRTSVFCDGPFRKTRKEFGPQFVGPDSASVSTFANHAIQNAPMIVATPTARQSLFATKLSV